MAAIEIEENPLLVALRPGGAMVAAIGGMAPYDALLVPECHLFRHLGVEPQHVTEEFLRHHVLRFTTASAAQSSRASDAGQNKGRASVPAAGPHQRQPFTTAAGVAGVFGDGGTITLGGQTLAVKRRLSSDMLAAAMEQYDEQLAAPPPPARRSSSLLLRRSGSTVSKAPTSPTQHIPDVFVVSAPLCPLERIAPAGGVRRSASDPALGAPAIARSAPGTPTPEAAAPGASIPAADAPKQPPAKDGTTFAAFQQKLLNDTRLRPITKRMRNFLTAKLAAATSPEHNSSMASSAAAATATAPPTREEVRSFISATADDLADVWEVWADAPASASESGGGKRKGSARGEPAWVKELREHTERYVCIKLHDALFVPDPADVEFAAHRTLLLSGGGTNLPDDLVAHVPDAQRRTWRKAVECLEDLGRWRAPADKATTLERCIALLRQFVGHALIRRTPLTVGETPAEAAGRDGVDQHLRSAVRLCVLHHAGTTPRAQLEYVYGCRSLAALAAGDLKASVRMVLDAVNFWTVATPDAAADELAQMAALILPPGTQAGAAVRRDCSPPLPPASGASTPEPIGGATAPTAASTASGGEIAQARPHDGEPCREASPLTAAEGNLSTLMRRLNETFESPSVPMPKGMAGRIDSERIEIVDDDEARRRAEWDAKHEQVAQDQATEWAEELVRRREAEAAVAVADTRWEQARLGARRIEESKAAELDAIDETRLAMWEADLIKLGELTDGAYEKARAAWSAYAEEVQRNEATTSDHSAASARYLDDERAELHRRADALTDRHRQTASRLSELQSGIEECVQSFHAARTRQEQALDTDRQQFSQILADGIAAHNQREAELDARERALEERRATLEQWFASREGDLARREDELRDATQERDAAAERLRDDMDSVFAARDEELRTKEADLCAREEQLEGRFESRKNDLAEQESEVALRRAAFDSHAVELRAALAAEVKAVEARVRTSERASREAREAAEQRLSETRRAAAAAEAAHRERQAALDRRQAELDRRQRVAAIAEERASEALAQQIKEVVRRADADRQAVADIEANLKARQTRMAEAESSIDSRRAELEKRAQMREAAAAARISAMRSHCKGEFHEALRILRETDKVDGVSDFRSLALKDLEALWSTMEAFRSVKTRFVRTVSEFERMESSADGEDATSSPTTTA